MSRIISAVLLCAAPLPALSQASVALLPGWAEADGSRVAGLSIALEPGWKTYWRSPGEGGLPPVFDWSGSSNLSSVTIEWPAPTVMETYGMTSLVYDKAVVLPLRVKAQDPSRPVRVDLDLSFGVCADICVPAHAAVAIEIAPDAPPSDVAAIRAHLARVPMPADAAGVEAAACGVRGAGIERVFEAHVTLAAPATASPAMLVEGPETAWFGPVTVARAGSTIKGTGAVQVYGDGVWIGRDALRLTLLWPDRAIDVQGCAPLPR